MTLPVAVIICTRDRPGLLESCLASIAPQLAPGDEAVVVDSASRDPRAVAEVASRWGFTTVRAHRPGLSVARNHGLAASSNPIVLFTDDDCRPDAGWVASFRSSFSGERLGFLTGPVRADRPTRLPLSVSASAPDSRADADEMPADPAAAGHGANMAFRRSALDEVGGFDEALGAGGPLRAGEDTDIFWRLTRRGWHAAYDPDASVTHVQWRTTAAALRVSVGYGIGAGATAAKRVRLGDRSGWSELASGIGRRGLGQSWRDLRAGYQSGALAAAAQAAGVVVGALRGARWPIDGSRFAGRYPKASQRTVSS